VKYIQFKYINENSFYSLFLFYQDLDHPDQRITQDLDRFTSSLALVIAELITAPLIIALYSYLTVVRIAWYAPLLVLAYFLVGYVIQKILTSPIVRLVFFQERLEGDFRYRHVVVRRNAESLALCEAGAFEGEALDSVFGDLIGNQFKIILRQFFLNSNVFVVFFFFFKLMF